MAQIVRERDGDMSEIEKCVSLRLMGLTNEEVNDDALQVGMMMKLKKFNDTRFMLSTQMTRLSACLAKVPELNSVVECTFIKETKSFLGP